MKSSARAAATSLGPLRRSLRAAPARGRRAAPPARPWRSCGRRRDPMPRLPRARKSALGCPMLRNARAAGERMPRGAAGRPPFAAIQDVLQRRHRSLVGGDAAERFDRLSLAALHRPRVTGVFVRMCRNSGAAFSSRKAPSDCRIVSLVCGGAALQRLLEHLVRLAACRPGAIARNASRCTAASLSSSMVRRSGSAASPPRARSRSTAARRTAGFRELRSSLAYSRAAGPNEIRMSRRRRTVSDCPRP